MACILIYNLQLITKLWFVQQTYKNTKWLEVVHKDALLFSASGFALQDPHHCLKTHTNHRAPLDRMNLMFALSLSFFVCVCVSHFICHIMWWSLEQTVPAVPTCLTGRSSRGTNKKHQNTSKTFPPGCSLCPLLLSRVPAFITCQDVHDGTDYTSVSVCVGVCVRVFERIGSCLQRTGCWE